MNLMLTATCDDTDAFHEAYLAVKSEFADWCDVSRCVFGKIDDNNLVELFFDCLLYTSPSPRDRTRSRMPSSA